MDLKLKDKTAIVTGGTTGIGAGICEVLADEGMNVIANYLFDADDAIKFADSIARKSTGKCVAMYGDISKTEDIDKIFKEAEALFGHVDVLVNNAGIWPTTPVEEMPDEEWTKVIDINLNGTYFFCKRAIMHFLKHDVQGHIVNLSSKSGFAVTSPDHAHYATAKGAITLLTKSLAREVANKGITINGIAPGMVRTPFNEDKLSQPEWMEYYQKRIPVGRLSKTQEIGRIIAFLASEHGEIINGTIVDATGGMLI
ncbi:MAG: SDR family oxidoreductase [Clostridia bacterium]|nr:SDR family oxidoreductase [Clostridia bacterium]MBT7123107.1 SDR family oxidoreductase [Clostridia bacterium]